MSASLQPEPPRRCLEVALWPAADRAAWAKANAPGGPLDEAVSRAAEWRAPTRDKVRKGYGRWLSFLHWSGRLGDDADPASRITPDAVRGYVTALQAQVAPWTVWSYVVSLHQCSRAFSPDGDWRWLHRLASKLAIRRRPTRNKIPKLRPVSEIAAWASKELDRLALTPDFPSI